MFGSYFTKAKSNREIISDMVDSAYADSEVGQ